MYIVYTLFCWEFITIIVQYILQIDLVQGW